MVKRAAPQGSDRLLEPCQIFGAHTTWRRGRDLNPRGSSPTRFPIVRTRPDYATSPGRRIVYHAWPIPASLRQQKWPAATGCGGAVQSGANVYTLAVSCPSYPHPGPPREGRGCGIGVLAGRYAARQNPQFTGSFSPWWGGGREDGHHAAAERQPPIRRQIELLRAVQKALVCPSSAQLLRRCWHRVCYSPCSVEEDEHAR